MTAARVLVVDDNPLDIRALVRAANRLDLDHEFVAASTGEAAIEMLDRWVDANALPDLLLFDLHLPGTDGIDLLIHRSNSHRLSEIPAIILTSSSDDTDRDASLGAGADAFITKPADLDGWLQTVAQIDEFWSEAGTIPN